MTDRTMLDNETVQANTEALTALEKRLHVVQQILDEVANELGWLGRNLQDVLAAGERTERAAEIVHCMECESEPVRSLAEALRQGWTELMLHEGRYMGMCPQCMKQEDDHIEATRRAVPAAESVKLPAVRPPSLDAWPPTTTAADPASTTRPSVLMEQSSGATAQRLLFGDDPSPPPQPHVPCSRHVARIRPPVKAHGGKYYLARQIVPILLDVRSKVDEYLEPCAFGASVYLAMPKMQREILGDVNPDVANLWRTLSDAASAATLRDRLPAIPYSRAVFERAQQETGGTTIDQAVRFLIRCRFSRGGLGTTFAWSDRERGGRPGDENAWLTFWGQELPKIIERAQGVEITGDPCWWTVWESREKIRRLIYADPPYMPKTRTAKSAYGPYEMTPLHHFWLVAALRAHNGPAAISGYRCAEYDRWLHDWRRHDFDMPNNAGQSKRKQRRTESLWVNW